MSSAPVLRFYDTSLPTTLQVDARKSGLEASLMQQGRPVAYASRALSNSELNYAPIEKETPAIVFYPVVIVLQVCRDVPSLLERLQAKHKKFYDRGAKQLPPRKEGDSVRFRKPGEKHLEPVVVRGKHEALRS